MVTQSLATYRGSRARGWLLSSGIVMPTSLGFGGTLTLSLLLTGRPVWSLATVAWLVVYSSYLIDSLGELETFDHSLESERSRHLHAKRHQVTAYGVAAFILALVLAAINVGPLYAAGLLVFPLAVALYALPVLGIVFAGRLRWRSIKDIPYAKSFYTAFFWGLLGVFAVAYLGLAHDIVVVLGAFILFAYRLFINTVFCDLKDIERDRAAGILNLAVKLGRDRVLHLLTLLNVLMPAILCALVWAQALPTAALGLSLTTIYTHALFRAAHRSASDDEWLCNVVADAEWLPWPLYTVIGIAVL